jgi:hypothetical protein
MEFYRSFSRTVFGGLGVAYGGYSLNNDHPLIALLSYVLGGAFVAASVVLAFLRIDRSARHKRLASAQGEVAQTLEVALQGTRLDPRVPDSNPKIVYKAKVIATFFNRGDQSIHFLPASWISGPGNVGIQSPFLYRYRVDIKGQQEEFEDVHIEPQGQFSIWVGLDKSSRLKSLRNDAGAMGWELSACRCASGTRRPPLSTGCDVTCVLRISSAL